ncbi:MAG: hypothetical protein GVY31_13430 [Alphaproteobacteria bacterium]|jgi:hypothetical protein|nr:hypothetical protein [Alphaproteobacteria bacterium]
MKRGLVAAAVAANLAGGPVWSLSCMPPDAARSFQRTAQSDKSYSALLGTLAFEPVKRPPVVGLSPDPITVSARFSGLGLGAEGFAPIADREIDLVLTCLASWCGTLEPGTRLLAFARHVDGGYEITVDPCYSQLFIDPAPEIAATVEACMRGDPCEPAPPR